MKVGDSVTGILFDFGTVVAIGTAQELKKYDYSGAVSEAIRENSMEANSLCVAVDTSIGTAVYDAEEVWNPEEFDSDLSPSDSQL